MEDVRWVQMDAWHGAKEQLPDGSTKTFCGETAPADADVSESLPAAKSCELCLRILMRLEDEGAEGVS
jgi:hypothetical protein